MNNSDIQREAYLSAIKAPGVNVLAVAWTSTVKPAAAHKASNLTKRVTATVMTGVEYANLSVNNDRETGTLPWGEWSDYPYIVTHKGRDYARLYTVDGTVKAAYFVDGREVRKADFDALLTPSARETKRPHGGTITVKMDSLTVL
jgi:hypothetical protein